MKRLNLLNQENESEKVVQLNVKEMLRINGGQRSTGCCHGMCQDCPDNSAASGESSADNVANDSY